MFNKTKNWLVELIFNNLKIVFLLFLFLIVLGSYSLSQMQRQGFPEVLINVASVQVIYPNAGADQIEDDVLKPIEAVLDDMDDVTEYQSIATDSFGSVFVTIDQKVDLDTAFAELKNELAGVDLPDDAEEPNIEKFSAGGPGEFIVAVAGLSDVEELFDAGESLKEDLESLPGVKEITPTNPTTPEIVIVFDEDDLAEYELTRAQVEESIRTARFSLPVGSFESDEEEVSVILQKDVESITELKNLLVADDVQLKDVASVQTRFNNNGFYNRIGFRTEDDIDEDLRVERAFLYAVKIQSDADIIEVGEEIDALLEKLSDDDYVPVDGKGAVSEDVSYAIVYSQADATQQQIDEITHSIFGTTIEELGPLGFIGYLLGGIGLVVILLFIFMNVRVALMAAAAIPLSLFFAAIYLNFVGIDLNTLVLFAMVLTVGLVVDPTIVFLESMQRYKQQGLSGREAATKTVQTVGLGVFLAVATNILVFVPFGVVSGFFGEIIKYIPATVIPAMIASMLIPVVFFTPLASKILSSKGKKWTMMDQDLIGTWRIARAVGAAVKWLLGKGKFKVVLRFIVFLFGLALPFMVGGALVSSGAVEVVQFSEQDDSDFMLINADITDEWTMDRAITEVVGPVQEELKNYPEIKNFSYFEQSGNSFSMLVTLFPIAEREERDLRTSDEVAADINVAIDAMVLDADVEASTSSEGPPQDEFPVRIRLLDNDQDALLLAAEEVRNFLEEQEGVGRVEDNISEATSGGTITFDLKEDVRTINPFFVYSLMNARIAESDLGTVNFDDMSYDLVSVMEPEVTSEATLTSIRITTEEEIIYEQTLAALIEQGVENPEEQLEKPAPLYVDDLIDGKVVQDSETIQRINGQRYVEVFATVEDDADALAIQADLEEYLSEDKLEEFGLSENATEFKGEADSISQSFTELFIALAISIFMIYVLLVGFFRSYLEPFIILFAIPLGMVGVFGAVAATTGQLGFLELLGVVAMAGIVVNVTILLIDYANQLKRSGKTPAEAISTSVAVRFRPIVLTQLTAFGSLIPLVYLSPFWKGLAASIIFGIATSALLSLFMTPILYLWANTVTRTIGKIPQFFRKLRIAYKNVR